MESWNLEWLNKKTIHYSSFSLPLPKNNGFEHNVRVNSCSYEMSSALFTNQRICTKFEEKDDRLCDITKPIRYQKEPLPISRREKIANIQTDCFDTKKSISIKRGEDLSP